MEGLSRAKNSLGVIELKGCVPFEIRETLNDDDLYLLDYDQTFPDFVNCLEFIGRSQNIAFLGYTFDQLIPFCFSSAPIDDVSPYEALQNEEAKAIIAFSDLIFRLAQPQVLQMKAQVGSVSESEWSENVAIAGQVGITISEGWFHCVRFEQMKHPQDWGGAS